MATATPLLNPDEPINEGLMFIIGIGTVWLFIGTAVFWLLNYAPTPLGFGTALAHTAIPVAITVGGHELAHYIVADEYCRYPEVEFEALVSTTVLTIASIIGALLLVLLDVFGVVSLPKWLLLFGVASPGAVVTGGVRFGKSSCFDESALAGPMFNFIVGALLFLWFNQSVPFPTTALNPVTLVLSLTTILALYLGFFNALPIGPLDGAKVVQAREPITLTLWAVVLFGSAWLLFGPFL